MSHYQGTTLNTFLLDHQSSLLQSRYKITLLLLFTRKFHCDFLCWQQQNIQSFFFSHNIIIRCSCTRRCCEDCQSACLQIIKPALLAPHHKEHFTGETLILMPQQCAKKVVSDSRGWGGGGASGFCYRASEFCSQVKYFFEECNSQKIYEINSAPQKMLGASWNDVWASKCQLQLAGMASCKNDFLCILLNDRNSILMK